MNLTEDELFATTEDERLRILNGTVNYIPREEKQRILDILSWQAWHFRYLCTCQRKLGYEWGRIWRRWILRGRRDTFSTSGSICVAGVALSVPLIDVSGSSATNGDGFGAAGSCVAGVTLSAPQAPFAWQAWRFRYLHNRCQRKLGDEWGRIFLLRLAERAVKPCRSSSNISIR